MAEFFRMSGYAVYVWTSFGLGTGALLLNVWWARHQLAQARREAKRRLAMRSAE